MKAGIIKHIVILACKLFTSMEAEKLEVSESWYRRFINIAI